MLELKAGAFVDAVNQLVATISYISGKSAPIYPEVKEPVFHEGTTLEESDRRFLRYRLTSITEYLSALGADVTMLCVEDCERSIGANYATWGTAKNGLDEIKKTLVRELSLKTVLVLQSQEASLFAPKDPLFGQDFADKFKTNGAFELDEAAKCRALSRPTAAVFHLMRILEIGIGALSACLGIPDPVKPAERNWAIILKRIKEDGIEKKWPTAADRMSGEGLLFESLHASLDAVKNPWRNEAMHISGKYTDDEARHIFVAVEGFMKRLSARMDENGEPKA